MSKAQKITSPRGQGPRTQRLARLCVLVATAGCSEATPSVTPPPTPRATPSVKVDQPTPLAGAKCDTLDGLELIHDTMKTKLDAGDARGAVALVQDLSCFFIDEGEAALVERSALLVRDYTHALYEAGDYASCHALAARHAAPYPGNIAGELDDDSELVDALYRTAERCRAKVDEGFEGFEASECTLAEGEQLYGVPAAQLIEGAEAMCLEVLAKRDADGMYEAELVVHLRDAEGTRRLVLEHGGGDYCNLEGVGFRADAGALLVYLHGLGRDCNGGTASASFQEIHRLEQGRLVELTAHHVGYH